MRINDLNIAIFLMLNCLILSIMTKWHKSIFLDELPEYKRSGCRIGQTVRVHDDQVGFLGSCLRSNSQSSTHDCRSGRFREHPEEAHARSHLLPFSG